MTSQAKKISKANEVGMDRLKVIYNGMNNPLRELPANEAAKLSAQSLLWCAKMYMGVQTREEDKPLYAEGAAFIFSKFPFLGVGEIREAFAMAASGKFDVDMKAYYGTFSLSTVGEILTNYTKYRNKIAQAIKKEIELKEKEERELAEKDMKNQDTQEEVCKEIANLIAAKNEGIPFYDNWKDIPSFYTQIALEKGIIVIDTDRKKEIWKAAKLFATKEMKQERCRDFLSGLTTGDALREYVKNLEEGSVKGFDAKARNIYSKLLLWEIIKP